MTDNAPDVVARISLILEGMSARYGIDVDNMFSAMADAKDLIETQAARFAETEAECLEQSRIIGKGAERELALQARVAELEARIALADRLAGYAAHKRSCGVGDGQFASCTCGLSEALAAYEAKP